MEQTWAGRKKEKCCGPWLKAADHQRHLSHQRHSFLKSEKVIQQSKVVSILDNNEGRSYRLSRMGRWLLITAFIQTDKRSRAAGRITKRPLLCEATAPVGPQGAFHCLWLAARALILENVTYTVVNFKTASKMYSQRGKKILKSRKINNGWNFIKNKILPWSS